MDKFDILVSLILSQTHLCLFNFHQNVSVSHWFVCSSKKEEEELTSKTIQSEITHPARWRGCRKMMSKAKKEKEKKSSKRKRKKKHLIDCVFK